MSVYPASFKLFLINGFFSLPSDLDLSQELLSTHAHCTLVDSFMTEPFASTDTTTEQLLLSGELKLYTQYMACTASSAIKQHQSVLPFCEYITLPSGAHKKTPPHPHIAIQDVYATLLSNQLIYYNISLVATL